MWRHRLPETTFFFCRLCVCYGALIAFLSAPPVVFLNQRITEVVQPYLRHLSIEQKISAETKYVATVEAIRIVWLGRTDDSLFSELEVDHLQDVHRLFIAGSFLLACAVIISILVEKQVLHSLVNKVNRGVAKGLFLFMLLSLILFPVFFDLFHQIFFPQGNYSFAPDSMIIQCFPPVFWLINFIWMQSGVIILLWWQAHHAEDNQI